MDDYAEIAFKVNPATLASLSTILHTVFGGFADIMESGSLSLFFIGVVVSVGFILFAIGRAMTQGGGAVFETIAFRVFIITALTAFVVGFPAFGRIVRTDINAFAARLAGANGYVVAADFTPEGILRQNDGLIAAVYNSGKSLPEKMLNVMNPWKMISVFLIQLGSAILAFDLLFGNISLDIVFGICAFLVGLIMNPWLSSFTQDFFKLIVSAGIFVIAIGAFVSVGQAVTGIELGYVSSLHGAVVSGPDMATVAVMSILFPIMASLIPWWLASRIGGNPGMQLGAVLSSVRSGKASVGL